MDTAIIIFLLLPNTPSFSAGPAKHRLNADAPMRGRPSFEGIFYLHRLFQSTPPYGGDCSLKCKRSHSSDFNPRPIRGRRHSNTANFQINISIHAPIRGRLRIFGMQQKDSIFQSTPPHGGDSVKPSSFRRMAIFQSTPPHGGDKETGTVYLVWSKFQSTPPRGGDFDNEKFVMGICDFNPRPLAGATITGMDGDVNEIYFNPRPLAGATLRMRHRRLLWRFQSTPPRGGDQSTEEMKRKWQISIHAPSRGRPMACLPL